MLTQTAKKATTKTPLVEEAMPYTKGRTYHKIDDNLVNMGRHHNLSISAMGLFVVLTCKMLPNSSITEKLTYKTLREFSGISSDQTISKLLKELIDSGFVSRMDDSHYRIWKCAFKGLREDADAANGIAPEDAEVRYLGDKYPPTPEEPVACLADGTEEEPATNNEVRLKKPTTNYVVLPHAYIAKPNIKTIRNVGNLKFLDPELEGRIGNEKLSQWITQFGEKKVQTVITHFETTKPNIQKSTSGFIYTSLLNYDDWNFKISRKAKQQQKSSALDKKMKKSRASNTELAFQDIEIGNKSRELEKKAFRASELDESIRTKAFERTRQEYPDLIETGVQFKLMFKGNIIGVYQEMNTQ